MINKEQETDNRQLEISIIGLNCSSSDSLIVEKIIRKQAGVLKVYVNPVTEICYIEYDPVVTSEKQLQAIVKGAGFGQKRRG